MTGVAMMVDGDLDHHKSKPRLGGKAFSRPKGGCSMAGSKRDGSCWLKMVAIVVVEARNGLVCGQRGQKRCFLAFG